LVIGRGRLWLAPILNYDPRNAPSIAAA